MARCAISCPLTRIFHDKAIYPDDGAIVEMTIWDVPEPVPGSAHRLKYSLSTAIRGVGW